MLPPLLLDLTEKFRAFPGMGLRSSQKLALDVLQMPEETFEDFLQTLRKAREQVTFCENCGFFAQRKERKEVFCEICRNQHRDKNQICLVEKPTDILNMEKSQIYHGTYHVLKKLISPLENVFAEQTGIADLVERRIEAFFESRKESEQKEVKLELILFFKEGFAAQATTAYLRQSLEQKGLLEKIKLTRLAQGLPLYYNPDTLDQATMVKALEDRREII